MILNDDAAGWCYWWNGSQPDRGREGGGVKVSIGLRFVPQDLWVGCYWKRQPERLSVYICLIPMLPIVIRFRWQLLCKECGGPVEDCWHCV